MKNPISSGALWSATDSWLTNITALGAVLTLFVSNSSSFGKDLSKSDITGVVMLSIASAFALAMGPVIYAALSRVESDELSHMKGTFRGLFVADFVTVFAVASQVATIVCVAYLIPRLGSEQSVMITAGSVVDVFVITYSVRNMFSIVSSGQPNRHHVRTESVEFVSSTGQPASTTSIYRTRAIAL